SGPLGIILTGAAAVSAAGYLIKHQKEITTKVSGFRTLIAETRTRFEETQGGYRAGRYDAASRNLMVDGLLKRFLEEVDAAWPWGAADGPPRAPRGGREPRPDLLGRRCLRRAEPAFDPLDQHQGFQAADGEADEEARAEDVLDLAAAELRVGDD